MQMTSTKLNWLAGSRAGRKVMGAALVMLAAACSSSDLPSATEPLSGSGLVYTLVSVESKALPATVSIGQDANVAVISGKLTLAPDSTWIVSHVIATTTAANSPKSIVTLRGSYSRAGTTLTMKQTVGSTAFTGTYSDNLVTLTAVVANTPGTAFSYSR